MLRRIFSPGRAALRGGLMIALIITATGLPGALLAHDPAPAHGCTAPLRPVDDQDDREWQRFLDEVDRFRGCISDYAAANHTASRVHREAANAATLEWNEFVRNSLNVPEDFPWPPE